MACRRFKQAALLAFVSIVLGCNNAVDIDADLAKQQVHVDQLTARVAEAKRGLWLQEAKLRAVTAEMAILEAPAAASLKELVSSMPDAAKTMSTDALPPEIKFAEQEWSESVGKRNDRLVALAAIVDKHAPAAAAVVELERTAADFPERAAATERQFGARLEESDALAAGPLAGTVRAAFSRDFFPVWAAGLIAVLAIWGVVRYEHRRRIRASRRLLRNEWAMGMLNRSQLYVSAVRQYPWPAACVAAAGIVTLASFSLRPSLEDIAAREVAGVQEQVVRLEGEERRLAADGTAISVRLQEAEKKRDELRHKHLAASTLRILGVSLNATNVPALDAAALNQLGKYQEVAGAGLLAVADAARQEQVVADQDRRLAQFAEVQRAHWLRLLTLKGVLAGGFLTLNLGLIWCLLSRRKSREARFNDCPRCLAEKSLKPIEGRGITQVFACSDTKCNYKVKAADKNTPRICIPAHGYTMSGKSVWLAMLHRQARLQRAGTRMTKLLRVQSPNLQAEKDYDDRLSHLVDQRFLPSGTQLGIPEPLLFKFADADLGADSGGLLNVFDYAGATTSPEMAGTTIQQRALQADGILYFIDPDPQRRDVLKAQQDQLQSVCEELRSHGAAVPIAVCISKLDLLAAPGRPGYEVFDAFVREMLPEGHSDEPTLCEVRRRHELFIKYREQFFPGWDLKEQFQNIVGGQFLFFPMSSAGFTGQERRDAKDWNFQPFGILEPILWLLHMQGFKTLKS